jgi:hypothetical protein
MHAKNRKNTKDSEEEVNANNTSNTKCLGISDHIKSTTTLGGSTKVPPP